VSSQFGAPEIAGSGVFKLLNGHPGWSDWFINRVPSQILSHGIMEAHILKVDWMSRNVFRRSGTTALLTQ